MNHTYVTVPLTVEQMRQMWREDMRTELSNYVPKTLEGTILPELLTRRQTAETLQVSLTTLHDWAKDTEDRPAILIPFKINGRVRYRRADVLSALKESRRFKNRTLETA